MPAGPPAEPKYDEAVRDAQVHLSGLKASISAINMHEEAIAKAEDHLTCLNHCIREIRSSLLSYPVEVLICECHIIELGLEMARTSKRLPWTLRQILQRTCETIQLGLEEAEG